jgi:23S rRNA (cytosine1962-C5)-methyltransferase
MFTADGWKEYRLIDASDGERLESWSGHLLIRPDPQVIWNGAKKSPLWKKADGVYRREGGGGSWIKKDIPEEWNISYGDMTFVLSPMGFKHTGLFPEQAANWDWFAPLIKNSGRKIKLLNLFAYTGGASVAAAKAGAFVCHVDASKGMVLKAKQNASLSGVPADGIRYIVDDCVKFVKREIRRGNKYDAVIMDPPSYGRGPDGEVWKLENQIGELLTDTAKLLSDDALFVFLNSYTGGLSPTILNYMVETTFPKTDSTKVFTEEIGLRVTNKNIVLPCGNTTVWIGRDING